MKIVLASNNQNKLREFRNILEPLGYEVITQAEAGADIEADENGSTFEENAFIKANAAHQITKLPVIADDSGLEVDFLGGAPGVYSARYAEPGKRCAKVLAKLEAAGLIQRTANDKDRRTINISLTEEGRIAAQEAYAKRDKVRHEMMSNLNETEQEQLLKLLEKLTADYSARYPKKSRANA